jgi:DNA-binding GntR family transcriptional regulator
MAGTSGAHEPAGPRASAKGRPAAKSWSSVWQGGAALDGGGSDGNGRRSGGAAVAYRALRTAIVEGQLQPGQRLIEQRLAEELSLSRTPIREAVRMLTADGLVVAERHRGAIVRKLDHDDVLDLYELRGRLEGYACERAATRITPEQLAMIDQGIDAFSAAVLDRSLTELDRTRRVSAANGDIHGTIILASNHERLAHILSITVDAPAVFAALRGFSEAQLSQSNLFHRLIRDAIARGEPTRAGQLMHEHIMQGRDEVLAQIGGDVSQYKAIRP